MAIKQDSQQADIVREITPQMLRHTFATHLFEAGTDILYIQDALSHATSKATVRYTRVARNRFVNKSKPNRLKLFFGRIVN